MGIGEMGIGELGIGEMGWNPFQCIYFHLLYLMRGSMMK